MIQNDIFQHWWRWYTWQYCPYFTKYVYQHTSFSLCNNTITHLKNIILKIMNLMLMQVPPTHYSKYGVVFIKA